MSEISVCHDLFVTLFHVVIFIVIVIVHFIIVCIVCASYELKISLDLWNLFIFSDTNYFKCRNKRQNLLSAKFLAANRNRGKNNSLSKYGNMEFKEIYHCNQMFTINSNDISGLC